MNLIDQIHALSRDPQNVKAEIGVVTGTGTRRVDVSIAGTIVPNIPISSAYTTPTIGDLVYLLKTGSSWIVAFSVPKQPTAYIPEGSFERYDVGVDPSVVDYPTWQGLYAGAVYSAFSTVSSPVHSGTKALRLNLQDGATAAIFPGDISGLSVGDTIHVGGWLKADSSTPYPANAKFFFIGDADPYGGPTAPAPTTILSITPTTEWTYFDATWTIPSTLGAQGLVRAYWQASAYYATGATGRYFLLDDLLFESNV